MTQTSRDNSAPSYNYNWRKSCEIRLRNWKIIDNILGKKIQKVVDFKYSKNQVPLGYIIKINNRDKIRKSLARPCLRAVGVMAQK